MRLPDFSNVIIDGTPFVDAGGRRQQRYISEVLAKQKAEQDKLDPGAMRPDERKRLDAAEAELAKAQAEYDAAAARWTRLKVDRWRAQAATGVQDVARRVLHPAPNLAAVDDAEMAKTRSEAALQATLIERTRELHRVDGARWWRRHEAGRVTK